MIFACRFLAAALLALPAIAAEPPAADPIGKAFFAPELVMQHQQAIDLSDTQRDALKKAMREAQTQFSDQQWKLQDAVEEMGKRVAPPRVDEAKVLEQLQVVLTAERDVKRTQITLLVRIKNLLSEEQQQRLRALREKAS